MNRNLLAIISASLGVILTTTGAEQRTNDILWTSYDPNVSHEVRLEILRNALQNASIDDRVGILVRMAEIRAADALGGEHVVADYAAAHKAFPEAVEPLYGLCINLPHGPEFERYFREWVRLDPDNALPYYIKAAHMVLRSTNYVEGYHLVRMGNSKGVVSYRPLYAKVLSRHGEPGENQDRERAAEAELTDGTFRIRVMLTRLLQLQLENSEIVPPAGRAAYIMELARSQDILACAEPLLDTHLLRYLNISKGCLEEIISLDSDMDDSRRMKIRNMIATRVRIREEIIKRLEDSDGRQATAKELRAWCAEIRGDER